MHLKCVFRIKILGSSKAEILDSRLLGFFLGHAKYTFDVNIEGESSQIANAVLEFK